MSIIRLASSIALFLFGSIFAILGLWTAVITWTSLQASQREHGLLIGILGLALIGIGAYLTKRSKNH